MAKDHTTPASGEDITLYSLQLGIVHIGVEEGLRYTGI